MGENHTAQRHRRPETGGENSRREVMEWGMEWTWNGHGMGQGGTRKAGPVRAGGVPARPVPPLSPAAISGAVRGRVAPSGGPGPARPVPAAMKSVFVTVGTTSFEELIATARSPPALQVSRPRHRHPPRPRAGPGLPSRAGVCAPRAARPPCRVPARGPEGPGVVRGTRGRIVECWWRKGRDGVAAAEPG